MGLSDGLGVVKWNERVKVLVFYSLTLVNFPTVNEAYPQCKCSMWNIWTEIPRPVSCGDLQTETISHVHFMSGVLWGPKYLTTFTEHLLCEWHMHGPVDMQRNEVLPLPVGKQVSGGARPRLGFWYSDSSPGLSPLKRTADPLCNISDRSHGFGGIP